MKYLPEDLDTYIRNYQRYLGAIKRLDLEIEAKEAEINRLPGSIIRKPDGTNKVPKTTTRQVQLLWELDQLMIERDNYAQRVKIVDDLIKKSKLIGHEGRIIERRSKGESFYSMVDDYKLDSRDLKKMYWYALNRYSGLENFQEKH